MVRFLETHLGWAAHRLGFRAVTPVFDGANEKEIQAELARAWLVDRGWEVSLQWAWEWLEELEYDLESLQDENEARRLFIVNWLGELGYDVDRLETNERYARNAVAIEWLRNMEFDADNILPADPDSLRKQGWEAYNDGSIEACARLWYAQMLERHDDDFA